MTDAQARTRRVYATLRTELAQYLALPELLSSCSSSTDARVSRPERSPDRSRYNLSARPAFH